MATFRTYLKRVNKKGTAPIYIGFYLGKEKIEVPIKLNIDPVYFDTEKSIIKNSFEFANDYNLIISNIRATINNIFVTYRLKNEELNAESFWYNYNNPSQYKDFFEFCASYQKLRFQEVSLATIKKQKSCLAILKEFKNPLYFSDLTTEFFRKFVLYLRNKHGNAEVTIKKTTGIISIYLNDAIKKGFLKENPMNEVKLRGCMDTKAEALTAEELDRIINLYRTNDLNESTKQTISFFLFMCFSSLHISDAKKLMIDQIGKDDLWYMRCKMLNIRPKVVRVPIADPLRSIIDKQIRGRKSGVLWDNVMTDQKINKKLKYIAEMADVSINLSAKVGRHTFATIFLSKTRDINTLKEIMGHSNIKQTMVYSHVLNKDRSSGIKVFNSFII